MASLNMGASFPLNKEEIDKQVTKTSAGNYALGYTDTSDGLFVVEYVGRADTDLNKRLKDWVGTKYKRFKFSYATSAKAAFEKECENYHDFKAPDNKVHPARPTNTTWKCPRCDVFD